MPGCDVVRDKPSVWRDDEGLWHCDQVRRCRRCNEIWSHDQTENATWGEAMDAAEELVLSSEHDRQRQYDKPPDERVEPPWIAAPGVVTHLAPAEPVTEPQGERGGDA